MKSKPSNKSQPLSSPSSPEVSHEKSALSSVTRQQPTFKRILVPIDFSDCSDGALAYAITLAQKFQAKMILLHVVEPAFCPDNYLMSATGTDETNQGLIEARRERLNDLKQGVSFKGLEVELLVRMGRAQSDIPDTAKATDSDLIVMGTHGDDGLKQIRLGGTAERVIRHASCPVLTVRRG